MKLPQRTLVSWNIYFHDVEWLQTRTPPLYFMHDSNKIDFNHTVYILTETTLMPADIDIRYWQIPELKKKKKEQHDRYIQRTLIVTAKTLFINNIAHIDGMRLLTGMCFWKVEQNLVVQRPNGFSIICISNHSCPFDMRELR